MNRCVCVCVCVQLHTACFYTLLALREWAICLHLSMDENKGGGVQIRAFLPTCLLPTISLYLTEGGFEGRRSRSSCQIYLLADSFNCLKINPIRGLCSSLHYAVKCCLPAWHNNKHFWLMCHVST